MAAFFILIAAATSVALSSSRTRGRPSYECCRPYKPTRRWADSRSAAQQLGLLTERRRRPDDRRELLVQYRYLLLQASNDPRQPSAYTLERLQLWVLAVIIRMSWLRRVINALSFRVSEWGSRRNQLSEQRSHLVPSDLIFHESFWLAPR